MRPAPCSTAMPAPPSGPLSSLLLPPASWQEEEEEEEGRAGEALLQPLAPAASLPLSSPAQPGLWLAVAMRAHTLQLCGSRCARRPLRASRLSQGRSWQPGRCWLRERRSRGSCLPPCLPLPPPLPLPLPLALLLPLQAEAQSGSCPGRQLQQWLLWLSSSSGAGRGWGGEEGARAPPPPPLPRGELLLAPPQPPPSGQAT